MIACSCIKAQTRLLSMLRAWSLESSSKVQLEGCNCTFRASSGIPSIWSEHDGY